MKYVTLNAAVFACFLALAWSCSPKPVAPAQPPTTAAPKPLTDKIKIVYYIFEKGAYVESTLDTLPQSEATRSCRINYPAKARENNVQGTVWITMIINETGQLEMAEVSRGIGGGCDQEDLRAAKCAFQTIPRPFLKHGIPVKVKFDYPIRFRLD
jgi:TonB family protein